LKKLLFLLCFLSAIGIGILAAISLVWIIDNYFNWLKEHYVGRLLSDFIIIFFVAFVELVWVMVFFSLKKAVSDLIDKQKKS
jgi:predicted PurR-regulated permease PerM